MSNDKWAVVLIVAVMLQMGVIHLQIVVLGHKIDAVKCFERVIANKSKKLLEQTIKTDADHTSNQNVKD